ncbi:prephenate dehydratase [Thioalkalivibrio sp. ALJ16]|uniref:prephenate dehydratase n=1 Tax=Thioalkalivibrio sp. ALJ16 TaxID=1158762 RepID=UPI0003828D5F|nr:prephenate dehydratase [Thioalkalivibrio sp. ALJ16]
MAGDQHPQRPASELEDLPALRARIDSLDGELLGLLSERARCAEAVARVKRRQESNPVFYRPEREAEILRRVREQNPGPLSAEAVTRLFREIMSECLALEHPLNVAYLGPVGTFTHLAARKHFGHAVETQPLASIDAVFGAVETGRAQFGVVPIENSSEGVVTHTVDCFMDSDLLICGEVITPVHHHLLAQAEDLSQVKRVLAHAQALAQCRQWLDSELPHAEREAVSSNARAAAIAAADPNAAALASEAAAEHYNVPVRAPHVEDRADNTTRFLIIGSGMTEPSGADRTSIMLSTANRPGSLYSLLKPIAEAGISLTRIESRPSRCTPWNYVFFLDLVGHQQDPLIRDCLDQLRASADTVKVLGSYPQAAT